LSANPRRISRKKKKRSAPGFGQKNTLKKIYT
jgi:hypothetical protein